MTDAPFTSWDPTGLIILLSFRLNPSLHLCQSSSPSSFLVFLPNLSFKSTKKCLIVMQAAETVAPMQSDTLHLKLRVRAFSWHLYLAQRAMRADERVEVRSPAQGHFKRTHSFHWMLWLSWRSNQRPFKKGYFTDRPVCTEVINYHAGEENPGSYSNDCTWEASDWLNQATHSQSPRKCPHHKWDNLNPYSSFQHWDVIKWSWH